MELDELARLTALMVLGLPAILYWQALRKTNRRSALRYMLGIVGLFIWALGGVLLTVTVLSTGGERYSAWAAIVFLLAWVGTGVTGFLAFGVPPEFAHRIPPGRLKVAGIGFAIVAMAAALVAIALD